MDRDLQPSFTWWMFVVLSVYSVTGSRLLHSSGAAYSKRIPSGTHGGGGRIHPRMPVPKQQQQPVKPSVRPRPVVVKCHPDALEVVVQADMFNTGLLVDGRHLRLGSDVLGGGACRAVSSGPAEFTIWANLIECGTKLSSTKEKIIYSNVLVYTPEPSSDGLLRLDGATVPVECHYQIFHAVDGISLLPRWESFVSTATAEGKVDFSLRLMTGDWQFERGSSTYFLGDPIHFEASSIMNNHKPLRIFVDHCVATATSDIDSPLRYDFIEHHGCLSDAYQTNSSSRFFPRVEEHKLHFQIDAFKFYQEPRNQVYITCSLSAILVGVYVPLQSRACSFSENRWHSVDGNDQVCRSCDVSRQVKEPPPTQPPKTPASIRARPLETSRLSLVQNRPEQPVGILRVHPPHYKRYQSSAGSIKRDAENKLERTIQMEPFINLPSRPNKYY